MPVCGAAPIDTRLTSCSRTGTPALVASVMLLDVGRRLNQADAADDHRLLAAAHQRAAGVAIVHLDGLRDLRRR